MLFEISKLFDWKIMLLLNYLIMWYNNYNNKQLSQIEN